MLKQSIKEMYARYLELDKILARYHAQNKHAHNSLDARRYDQMYDTSILIVLNNELKDIVIKTRKYYQKLIKPLID